MYIVVHRNIAEGTHKSAITWTGYESKESYEKWNDDKMKSWYEVVAEGITAEEAVALCSTPEARAIALVAQLKSISETFEA